MRVRVPPPVPCFLNRHAVLVKLSPLSLSRVEQARSQGDFGCTLAVLGKDLPKEEADEAYLIRTLKWDELGR